MTMKLTRRTKVMLYKAAKQLLICAACAACVYALVVFMFVADAMGIPM